MFKDHGHACLPHPLFTLENLYGAYVACRRGKRGTLNGLRFEQDLEENLIALQEELVSGRYQPGKSVAFLVEKPKRREIFAAAFRDRVIHHLLVRHLEPGWERRFIHDSYACRKGKGTHKGVERLRAFIRQVTKNGRIRAWYLQLDIRGFFISVNRHILYERLVKKEHDPAVRWLIETLIFHEPTEKCIMRGASRGQFESLPPHKTLFKAAPGCGLPIGNLTSQFFGNIYLDALDQFVKHHLKARYYLRYSDDFVLLSLEKAILERWEAEIEAFLLAELALTLNPRRRLRPISDGIDFLGYIVRADYLLVRNRVVGACIERLAKAEKKLIQLGLSIEKGIYPWAWEIVKAVYDTLNSYLAHFAKASTYRLVERIRRRFPWTEEYYLWEQKRIRYRIEPLRPSRTIYEQRAKFERCLPGHILVVQMGDWWHLWGEHSGQSKKVRRAGMPVAHPENGQNGPSCSPLSQGWERGAGGVRAFSWNAFPETERAAIEKILWESEMPVGWIRETGSRPTKISERELFCRWAAPRTP